MVGLFALAAASMMRQAPLSADICARNPQLFKVRILTSSEADRFVQFGGSAPALFNFGYGRVVSGQCTRFIKSFRHQLITLTDNEQFVIANGGSPTLIPLGRALSGGDAQISPAFELPMNVRTIAPDKFAEGSGRSFVKSLGIGREQTVLWSGPNGSALGTIQCRDDENRTCALNDLILSSPLRILDFGYLPPAHLPGPLWITLAIHPRELAIIRYQVTYLL